MVFSPSKFFNTLEPPPSPEESDVEPDPENLDSVRSGPCPASSSSSSTGVPTRPMMHFMMSGLAMQEREVKDMSCEGLCLLSS